MGWVKIKDKIPLIDRDYEYRYNNSYGYVSKTVLEQWGIRGFFDVEWFDKDPDYKNLFESAIQLIKDIRHGNIYNNPSDEAQKWLVANGYETV